MLKQLANIKTRHFLTALFLLFSFNQAQAEQPLTKQEEARLQRIYAQAIEGPKTIKLANQASLELPKGMYFLPSAAANDYMDISGNATSPTRLGVVMTDDESHWVADISFEQVGYISDEDAKNWDADELLDSLKEGNQAQNEERRKRHIPELEIIGWVEKPNYDPATQRLVWSINARDLDADGKSTNVINYNTYVLGREGYIELDFITDENSIQSEKAIAKDLLSRIKFTPGKTYAEYNASTDQAAQFGLAALIGGAVVAKKLGATCRHRRIPREILENYCDCRICTFPIPEKTFR